MLTITEVDPETLIPDPNNVRHHNEQNRESVRRSLKAFGVRKPVVAHEATKIVYAGNLTLEVAVELGLEAIPVAWIPADVPESVCQAYAIADNRSNDLSEFDYDGLGDLLTALEASPDVDLADTGFDANELARLLSQGEGDFLDAFARFETRIDEADTTEAEGTEPDGMNRPELVKLNLLLLPADRDRVMETLNDVKQRHGLETHAQALVWLINDWRTAHE